MSLVDTHPSALQRQIELMRDATLARRFSAVRSLSKTVATLSRRALRRSMPEAPEEEVDRAFVALHYGEATATLLRRRQRRRT